MPVFAAVDVGASGGRVVRGIVTADYVELETVHRFANGVVDVDGHLRWDIRRIHDEVRVGLARVPEAASIGIDMWGVDYGLLDADGDLMAQPISYRDERTAKVIEAVHRLVSPEELYGITGIQHLPFNTIYQLATDEHLNRARHAVLLPDLLAYLLTGELRSELTNASTTALLDARTQSWSATLLERLGLASDLFPPLQRPGTTRGVVGGIPVVAVGSHDTASAVAGIPVTSDRFAYVASGTWSLVGAVLDAPLLTEAARAANFTNEIAVDGRTRFLRNVGGLWLLQECLRSWQRDDLAALLDKAAALPATDARIDVTDPSFIRPHAMPARVAHAAGACLDEVQTVRCILDSLADAYARTIGEVRSLTGRRIDVVHIIGGGSQNELLCQLTATATGLPVLAGPVEASAVGNVLVQAQAAGVEAAPPLPMRRYEP